MRTKCDNNRAAGGDLAEIEEGGVVKVLHTAWRAGAAVDTGRGLEVPAQEHIDAKKIHTTFANEVHPTVASGLLYGLSYV